MTSAARQKSLRLTYRAPSLDPAFDRSLPSIYTKDWNDELLTRSVPGRDATACCVTLTEHGLQIAMCDTGNFKVERFFYSILFSAYDAPIMWFKQKSSNLLMYSHVNKRAARVLDPTNTQKAAIGTKPILVGVLHV